MIKISPCVSIATLSPTVVLSSSSPAVSQVQATPESTPSLTVEAPTPTPTESRGSANSGCADSLIPLHSVCIVFHILLKYTFL